MRKVVILLVTSFFVNACATYYEKNQAFMQAVYKNDYTTAEKLINHDNSPKRNLLLSHLNKGSLYFMMGNHETSNKYFRLADYYVEDFQKNYASKALSFISNPKVVPYGGESFEQLMIHYYTAINYITMGELDNALVEAKRMLLKLQKTNDYHKGKNKYNKDAFVHHLIGVIYDLQSDYNNAFIAYKNALDIYENEYKVQFNTNVPLQLKKDLIRTAYLTGFYDEMDVLKEKYQLEYTPSAKESKDVLIFWDNGLGPVKSENSINFAIIPAGDGWVNFVNVELGLVFPYYVGNKEQQNSLLDLKIIRIAIPQYTSRTLLYTHANLQIDTLIYPNQFELYQPINEIAYKSLEDRMNKELAEALMRLATKKITESIVRKENEGLGFAIGLLNAISEQADTRNWQLLPHSVNYARIAVPDTTVKIYLNAYQSNGVFNTFELKLPENTNKKSVVIHHHTPAFKGYY
jgi:hypothetical protein